MQEFILIAAMFAAADAPATEKNAAGIWVLTDERGSWTVEADLKTDGTLKWERQGGDPPSGAGKWEKVGAAGVRVVLTDADGKTVEDLLLPDGRKDEVRVEADDKTVVWIRTVDRKEYVGHWKLEPFRQGAPPSFYEFRADGTCVYSDAVGDFHKGRWYLSASGKLLMRTGRLLVDYKIQKQSDGTTRLEGRNGAMYGFGRFKPAP